MACGRWVLRAWVLLARIKQVNGAMVAAVVGEPFHGVKSEKMLWARSARRSC